MVKSWQHCDVIWRQFRGRYWLKSSEKGKTKELFTSANISVFGQIIHFLESAIKEI